MNFDILRQKILEKAIRGELVPQLESEPEVLQIGEAQEDGPFAIPERWKWVRFGNLGKFSSPRRVHKHEWRSHGIPFLRARELANLADTGVLSNELFIDKKLFEIRKEKGEAPNPGDLVFTAVGTLGKCYVVKDGDIFFCKDTNTLRFSEHNQYSYYLRLLFQTPYIQKLIKETAIGSTVRNLTIGVMNNWLIPVPSIEEQHRIVTKINQLFEQIDHAEKAYKELSGPLSERFRQLCLEKAIQGKLVPQLESEPEVTQIGEAPEDVPFAIPEKWRWVRVSDVAHTNPKVTAQTSSTEVSFIPMAALSAGYISQIALDGKRSWGTVKNGYTKFVEGDVLLAKITPCFQNRKSAIAKKLSNGIGCGSSEFHVLRVNENIVTQEYLLMFLKSQWFITYGVENFKGTAGQQRLGTSDLKNCLFPLPPMSEQHRIVAKLNELLDSVKHLEYNVSKT